MPSQNNLTHRQNIHLGRSGPRSKTGCQTCRHRRVRCDEKRPVCGHCDRLKLECTYQHPQQRRRRQRQTLSITEENVEQCEEQNHSSRRSVSMDATGQPCQSDGAGTPNTTFQNITAPELAAMQHDHEQLTQDSHDSTIVVTLPPEETQDPQVPIMEAISTMSHDNGTYEFGQLGMASNTASMASVMTDLTAADAERADWSLDVFSDYLPFADPAFSFTSLGFTNSTSMTTDHASVIQPITTPESNHSWHSGAPSRTHRAAPRVVESGRRASSSLGRPGQTPRASTAQDAASQSAFAISPPILSGAQEEQLLSLFETDLRPPASLVGVDPLGWLKIKRYVLQMARDDNQHVMLSLFALSTLLSGLKAALHRTGINQDNHRLFASRLHDAASAAMEAVLSCTGLNGQNSRALLASVFFLAWFEIAQDEDGQARPTFPYTMAEEIIVNGKDWDNGSAHLFQWLDSLDAKMSHLGGTHLLSDPALEVVRRSQSSLGAGEPINEDNQVDTPAAIANTQRPQEASQATQISKSSSKNRLDYLLSTTSSPSLPRSVIRLDIFNILLHPAFEFHITSQAFSRRIGSYDRHHRSRGTPEDEREVMNACMGFEEELQELWKRRPGVLSLNAEQLGQFVSRDIATRLERLFSIYIATFWAHFVYIHRVAFWTLKHTAIVYKALQQVGNMMRRSVGQPIDQHSFDPTVRRIPANSIHPGLMWVCFLFGCEVEDPVQQEWAVLQLQALGGLGPAGSDQDSADVEEELLVFRLDEKGAQTALKTSQLLAVLVARQTSLQARVDGKHLCQEIFGCHFYII